MKKLLVISLGVLLAVVSCGVVCAVRPVFIWQEADRLLRPSPVADASGSDPTISTHAAAEEKEKTPCDIEMLRNSLTMRLAHHASVGQFKEAWKAPVKEHLRFRTEFHDFDFFRLAEIGNQQESIVSSADDGTRLYMLFSNPSWKGNQIINPAVPKYRLACFDESGKELWSKELTGTWLQALAPVCPGVLVQHANENNKALGAIYVSAAGDIRPLQDEGDSATYYGHGRLCDAVRRGHYWPWEWIAGHSDFLWKEYDQGKLTLVSPSKTACSGWQEPSDYWCVNHKDGSGAMYEIVWQQKQCKMLRLDLATRKLLVRSLYYDKDYTWNRDWEAITRRCVGVLDDCAIWIEETADGGILHSTDLGTGMDRTLEVPSARAPMQYQLTWDGKLFFRQGYRSSGYRMRAGNKSPDAWYFLANIRKMNANPEPCDMGPQSLWLGHPRRVVSHTSLMVLQKEVPVKDDVHARQEAIKSESAALKERRAGPSGPPRLRRPRIGGFLAGRVLRRYRRGVFGFVIIGRKIVTTFKLSLLAL